MLVKNKYLDIKSHTFVFMFNAKYQAMEYHDPRMFMQTLTDTMSSRWWAC